ncbi:MAG: hypothetical protein JNJ56_13230 [Ignavibacteria bacterium]|nr:hypothetical protein [Ignavibacteria bacterium]
MKIIQDNFKTGKTARYCTNSPSNEIKSLWFVIHGYAQLASDFIRSFDFLDNENTLIIAPEGLSRFYSRSLPAASWMTISDRENEIHDYVFYLTGLLKYISGKYDLKNSVKNLLGFSQGVHTAVRFFAHSDADFKRLVLCSSDFPPDADFGKFAENLKSAEMFYLRGRDDSIFTEADFQKSKFLLESNSIKFNEIVFRGSHEINKDSFAEILNYNK